MAGPLQIVAPCDADLDAMPRVPGGRSCTACGLVVHDLTRATRERALATAMIFGGAGRRVCGRLRVDEEGFGVFRPTRVRRGADAKRAAFVAAALATQTSCAEPSPAGAVAPSPTAPVVEASARCAVGPTGAIESASAPAPAGSAAASSGGVCPDGSPGPDCPAQRIVVTSAGDMMIVQHVTFAGGSSAIASSEQPILDAAAEVLRGHPEIRHLVVEGHTDASEKGAAALSLARAKAVVKYMVGKGVDPAVLEARGAGSDKPLASPTDPEGRAKNRRIDFVIEGP